MQEYKIITGTGTDCQKYLNQWRHQFHLTIISMTSTLIDNHPFVIILLTRMPKNAQQDSGTDATKP